MPRNGLQAMKQPVPHATPEAIAQDKAEIASRGTTGHFGKLMENFQKGPDVTDATKVGEPTLVDPKQVSAPDMVRAANNSIMGSMSGVQQGGSGARRERRRPGGERSCSALRRRACSAAGATRRRQCSWRARSGRNRDGRSWMTARQRSPDNSAVPEMKNDLQPAATTPPPGATRRRHLGKSTMPLPPPPVPAAAPSRRLQPAAVRRNSLRPQPMPIPKARRRKRRRNIGRSKRLG